MPCCKESHLVHLDDMKASAVEFGFDSSWIADLVAKYGDQILALVLEAVRGGFSAHFVAEVLSKFGPEVLQWLVNLLNKTKMRRSMGGPDVLDGAAVDITWIEILVQKYLPLILQQYGNQISQLLINWLINWLQNLSPQPVPTPVVPPPTPAPAPAPMPAPVPAVVVN